MEEHNFTAVDALFIIILVIIFVVLSLIQYENKNQNNNQIQQTTNIISPIKRSENK